MRLALLVLAPALLRAQNQTELIQTLLARIDKLEKRVAELETKGQPPPEAKPEPEKSAAALHHMPAEGPATTEGSFTSPSLHVAGFSDLNFAATDQRGSRSGFSEGQFILHFSSALSPKVNFFGEISLTARSDAGTGLPVATGFNAEVERSIIRYDYSDHFKVSFGRYHTPIGYWNTAYHHGSWLHTPISRPEIDRKSTRLNSSHIQKSRMPSSA